MADRLRPLWDFDDLDASEARFRELVAREPAGPGRAEVLTQLARVEGLRGRFDECGRLLDEAEALAGDDLVARTRLALERGRMKRSSGDAPAALPLFESAFELALAAGDDALAADAAHMAALAVDNREGFESWTRRGVDVARASHDPQATYWLGPLLNNLGWERYGAGEPEPALAAFEEALRAREGFSEQEAEIEIARYAVAKALRALGRADEAAALLERAVAWADAAGKPDGWFHEELAESYAALGRDAEAREQARRALKILPAADPSFEQDDARVARLRSLADAPS
jgi:tetratricopeptide (TPR) repeat protein